jgi:hypothetical protein
MTALATVASIARENGRTARQVGYAIRSRGIQPDAWVGGVRVYGPEAVARIVQALSEATARPAPRRPLTEGSR